MIDLLMMDIPTLLAQSSLPDSHESLASAIDRGEAALSYFGLSVSIIGSVFLGVGVLAIATLIFPRILFFLLSFARRLFELVFLGVADTAVVLFAVVCLVLAPVFAVFFLVLGRWEQANRKARWFGDNVARIGRCLGQMFLVRPLRVLFLDSTAAGIQSVLPRHMPDGGQLLVTNKGAATDQHAGSDPVDGLVKTASVATEVRSRRENGTITFPGFEIVGQLKAGGSGAKLFVARPSPERRARIVGCTERVVIKSFAMDQGSTLPSIVRESRALESGRRMGLVFEHHLEEGHFWYVMPYHAGDSLAVVVNKLHAASSTLELREESLRDAVGYVRDLVATLSRFHDAGLWHKDVKPDNLIVHDGRANLVDLGLVTSLQSPLTLTTHGTEYFRDPEMVRMALRGVRVHEVDGSKFDVYGAGAVLYFVLENDFPAHGGLSDFKCEVPDSLRWIVRRAMADYVKRYASSRRMLADLDTVLASEDLWAVRPADLPSMSEAKGEDAPAPPPPFTRIRHLRPSAPPMAANYGMGAVHQSKRRLPTLRRKTAVRVDPRLSVPKDRPTGMLIVLGLAAICTIVFAILSLLPVGTVSNSTSPEGFVAGTSDFWPTEITNATVPKMHFGRGTTTCTLISPIDSSRMLLVFDEDRQLESGRLQDAMEQVIEWSQEHYSVDPTPDLYSLGTLLLGTPESAELCSSEAINTGPNLSMLGYDSVARLFPDSNGNGYPELRVHARDNHIWVMEITPDTSEKAPWSFAEKTKDQVPDQGVADGHDARWISRHDGVDASALSWLGRHTKGPCAWTAPREPDCAHSWTRGSCPYPALSMRLSLEQSPMRVSMPRTSPEAQRPTWPAIRMSA